MNFKWSTLVYAEENVLHWKTILCPHIKIELRLVFLLEFFNNHLILGRFFFLFVCINFLGFYIHKLSEGVWL